ncbi:MAG: hypothetical protein ABEH38_04380 [Flavobacteriales bacterium]
MVRWKEPMLRTFGVTNLGPDKENRVIFYSILFIILATGIYILTFYLDDPKRKQNEDQEQAYRLKGRTGNWNAASSLMAGSKRSINFSQIVELPKSF